MKTRADKIKALNDLAAGRIKIADLISTQTTMELHHPGIGTTFLVDSAEVSEANFHRVMRRQYPIKTT